MSPWRPNEKSVTPEVAEAVAGVIDPRLLESVGEMGLVKSLLRRKGVLEAVLSVPLPEYTDSEELTRRVRSVLGPESVVRLVAMGDDERGALAARLYSLRSSGSPSSLPATGHEGGGPAGAAARPNTFSDRSSKTRVLAISSGKGGVGKSTVTVNLAIALRRANKSVALLDADVYGFSIPKMLGITDAPFVLGELLIPPVSHGIRCISMGFFVDEDQAVVWRGPMLHKALEQFLVDVYWGQPDFLLVDLPPGTGDVALSIAQFLPRAELYVVTTPQPAAERVAQRSAIMARQLRLPLRGVIENLSYFVGDDNKRYALFGTGGGAKLAGALGVPLLGEIPLVLAVREGGDEGTPVADSAPESEVVASFDALAEKIISTGPARVYRSELAVR